MWYIPDMKDEFSTFEIVRLFGINRNRLQEWLDGRAADGQPFFVPDKPADGQGTKAIFNRNDLYRLRLFIYFLRSGFSRMDAKEQSDWDFSDVALGKNQYALISNREGGKSGVMRVKNSLREVTKEIEESKIPLNLIIDLQALKAEVDKLVGE